MRTEITKRLYCKRAIFLQRARLTLQGRLTKALQDLRTVGSRKETPGEDGRYVRTVIYFRAAGSMLFGIMAGYERGTHQLTIADDDDDAETLTVEQVAPPKTQKNKRQEFLEGVCYFGVMKNHVVLATSRAFGAKPSEAHFNWLLRKSSAVGANDQLVLSDEIGQATKEKLRHDHVKEVHIGAPLFAPYEEDRRETGTVNKGFKYEGLGIGILRQILGSEKVERMRLSDAIDGNIEVTLSVRYKRTTTEKAHRVLDNIAMAVRNLDEDEVRLKLQGGGTVKGDKLKLSTPVHLEARDGIPDPDEIFRAMHSWLTDQLQNHIIEP